MDLNPALYLSPEMVAELALGLEPPITVVEKYGFTLRQFVQLQNMPWFTEAVYRERERQRNEGVTFQSKSRLMAEELWTDIYKEAKANSYKSELKVDVAKQLTEIAGLKPKNVVTPGQTGPSFTVNISIPESMQGPRSAQTILDVTPPAIDVQFDAVETPITGTRTLDVPVDFDLVGPMLLEPA